MSAVVLGKRSSSFFEELHHHHKPSSPPSASKRIRCCSPIRSSPSSTLLGRLRSVFPDMAQQLLVKALEASGDDLNLAIKSLNELHIEATGRILVFSADECVAGSNTDIQLPSEDVTTNGGDDVVAGDLSGMSSLPADGSEWVELFVREMTSASDVNDARARASRVLEVLENNIRTHANAEASQKFLEENLILKEQVEGLLRDNNILKRAVAIQHERQKESDERNQELQHLKHLVAQYQEQIRNLEVNNYALTLHLRQAQQSSSIPGRFHPDVF